MSVSEEDALELAERVEMLARELQSGVGRRTLVGKRDNDKQPVLDLYTGETLRSDLEC